MLKRHREKIRELTKRIYDELGENSLFREEPPPVYPPTLEEEMMMLEYSVTGMFEELKVRQSIHDEDQKLMKEIVRIAKQISDLTLGFDDVVLDLEDNII